MVADVLGEINVIWKWRCDVKEYGKWLCMEVKKWECTVQYSECRIAGCWTQDIGNEKGKRC